MKFHDLVNGPSLPCSEAAHQHASLTRTGTNPLAETCESVPRKLHMSSAEVGSQAYVSPKTTASTESVASLERLIRATKPSDLPCTINCLGMSARNNKWSSKQ